MRANDLAEQRDAELGIAIRAGLAIEMRMREIRVQRRGVERHVGIVDAAREEIRGDSRKAGAMRGDLADRRRGELRIGEMNVGEDRAERVVEPELAGIKRFGEQETREAARRRADLVGDVRGRLRAAGLDAPKSHWLCSPLSKKPTATLW